MILDEVNKTLNNHYSNDEAVKLKILEVLFLAEELLLKYHLSKTKIQLTNHFTALGKCYNNGEKISLLVNHIINSDIEEIKNTILHEIAHALVGVENGHNQIWQEKAKELGVMYFKNYRK